MGLTGKESEDALVKAGITANKNTIPFDTQSPMVTSGVRLGVPAVTTRGMKENEMRVIASFIERALSNRSDEKELDKIKSEVKELCLGFLFYKTRLKG